LTSIKRSKTTLYSRRQYSLPLKKQVGSKKFANVIKTEEKGSDVNLAVHMLNDAWLDKFDCAVLVSNDSDLAEALKIVNRQLNKKILHNFIP
jgi:uncharacterized LabA/DUF88 family protein